MQDKAIKKACETARRFIAECIEMEEEEKKLVSRDGTYHYTSPKHRGSVRRRSMDLTRALAEMRKP